MTNDIFVFTLHSKSKLGVQSCIFDETGNPIGRVLHKYPAFKDSYDEFEYNGDYSYDIESSKDTYKKLENNEITLFGIDDYKVSSCNTYYVHKEGK